MATSIPLQGSTALLQGATAPLQGGYNPQQTAAPQQPAPVVQNNIPAPLVPPNITAARQAAASAPIQAAQPIQLNQIFDPYIGTRASQVNPSVLEYFNKQTGQGFANPTELFNFASGLGAGQINSFDQLTAPINAQSQTQTTFSQTQQQPNLADPNQALAETAGSAGLSPQDLLALAQANSALTPDQIQQIYQSLGLSQAAQNAFATLPQSTVDLYNQAYQSAGLGDLKNQIQDLSSQIAKAQQDYLDASSTVNENPFLDEASRVGRIDRLNTEAQQRIGNLQQQQQNLNDLYTQGLAEANGFVTRYTNDFNTNRQQALAQLNYLMQQAQTIAQAQQTANAQKVFRYLPDFLAAKQQAAEPFGSAQYGYFKYNPQTKSFEQVSGPAAQFESNPITGELFNKSNGQPVGSSGSNISSAFGASAPAQLTLAQQNNNPGNIRNPATGQFMVFSTAQQGWQALVNDIQAKISGNNAHGLNANSTLQDFFNVYAPAGDGNNSPTSYAAAVAQQLGVSPNTKLGDLSGKVQDLAVAIATHEGYFNGSTAPGTASGTIIDQAAQRLVDNLDAPSQYPKTGQNAARNILIQDRANQLSLAQKGVPFDAQQAEINYQNKQNIQPVKDLEASLESHLNLLSQQSKAFNRSDIPAQNRVNFAFQQQTGPSNEMVQYLQTLQDAKGELAKVLSGGGNPTDEARAEADTMLNEYLGDSALQSQIQNALTNARQKLQAYESAGAGNTQQSLSVSSSPVDISDINFSF